MIKVDVEGFDGRQRDEAKKAFQGLRVPIRVDPKDSEAVARALEGIRRAIDERVEMYPDNPLVRQMGESVKEELRQRLLDRVAGANREGRAKSD